MQLYSQKLGKGIPLVILHGLLGMSDNWLALGRKMAKQGFAVHLLDIRNHGESPHISTHTYKCMCKDLLTYIDSEQLDSVTLLGHSMGGKVAMTFGLYHPKRLDKLIVLDIAPTNYGLKSIQYHSNIIKHLMEIDLEAFLDRREILVEIEQRLGDPVLTMFLGKSLMRDDLGYFSWKLNLSVLLKALPEIAGGFDDMDKRAHSSVDTLFLKGERSDYLGIEYDKERNYFFPNSELNTIADAGHWLHIEQPEKVLTSIFAFLGHK